MKPVLIYLRPLDQVANQRLDVRIADGPTADTYGTAGFVWEPAVATRPKMSIELMSPDMDGKVQAGQVSFDIALGQMRSLPQAQRLYWRGASVVIQNTGILEGPSAIPDFWGYVTSSRIDFDTGRLSITAEVSTAFIDKPLLTGEFTGGGGLLGEPAKRGVLWPVGFGVVKNIQPVWFDTVRSIGQIDGYGNTQSIDWLGEGLSSFGPRVADYATYAALAAAIDTKAIKPGQWGTCVAQGLVGLGAPPVGVITVHATFGYGLLGAMMKRILIAHAKVPNARVDTAAFDALNGLVPYPVHFWTDQQRNVKDLLESLAQSCNATPLVSFQNVVTVTRAVGGAVVATLDRSGSVEPRVLDWKYAEVEPPYYVLKARAARPASVLSDDQVNYVDTLEDKGVFDNSIVYRAGNLVWLADGSQWLYQNADPAAGHYPPTNAPPDGNGDVFDAWWFRRQPPRPDVLLQYQDGTPIDALRPAEAGATVGMTEAEAQLFALAVARIDAIGSDDIVAAGAEKQALVGDVQRLNDLSARAHGQSIALGAIYGGDPTVAERAARDDAMAALQTYLNTLNPAWDNMAVDTPVDGDTLRTLFNSGYSATQGLLAANANYVRDRTKAALDRIVAISSDSVLSAGSEKQQAIIDQQGIVSQFTYLNNQYVALGSPGDLTGVRDNASNALTGLLNYLGGLAPPWNDASTDTPIVASVWQQMWSNAIAAVAAFAAAITGRKGDKGDTPPTITLTSTSVTVRYDKSGVPLPGQAITFTAARRYTGIATVWTLRNSTGALVFGPATAQQFVDGGGSAYWSTTDNDHLTLTATGSDRIVQDHGGAAGRFTVEAAIDGTPAIASVSVQKVLDGAPGLNAPLVVTQWSVDGSSWHANYQAGDLYQRQSNDNGATFGPAVRVVGESITGPDGTSPSIVFKLSPTQPLPPTDNTGNPPSGWSDGPPVGTDLLWQSKATFRVGTQITSWSAPVRITGTAGTPGTDGFTLNASPATVLPQADYLGAVKDGQLPRDIKVSVFRGGSDLSGAIGLSASAPAGLTISTSGNIVSLTGATSDGIITIGVTYNGVTVGTIKVQVTRTLDPAPPSSVTSVSTGYSTTVTSTTYDTPTSKTVVLQVATNGNLTGTLGSFYSAVGSSTNRNVTVAAKLQYRLAGSGGWSDFGAEVVGGQASFSPGEPSPDGLSMSQSVSGLTAGQSYEVRGTLRIYSRAPSTTNAATSGSLVASTS